jgi:DNA-binding LytR/AlgR family response regulator
VLRGIDGGERMIGVDDILYIEVFGTELNVHCRRSVVLCSGTLVEASSLLSSTDFYRSHRSFIVNLRYTVGIERYQFRMVNGDAVAVAKNRYAEVKAAFEAYAGVKKRDSDGDGDGEADAAAIKADAYVCRE